MFINKYKIYKEKKLNHFGRFTEQLLKSSGGRLDNRSKVKETYYVGQYFPNTAPQ